MRAPGTFGTRSSSPIPGEVSDGARRKLPAELATREGIGGGLGMRKPGWLAGPNTAAGGIVGGSEALGGGPETGGGGAGIVAGPRACAEEGGAELLRRGSGGGMRLAKSALGLAGTTPDWLMGGGVLGTLAWATGAGIGGGIGGGMRDGGGGGIAANGRDGGGGGGNGRRAGRGRDAGAEILRPRMMPD